MGSATPPAETSATEQKPRLREPETTFDMVDICLNYRAFLPAREVESLRSIGGQLSGGRTLREQQLIWLRDISTGVRKLADAEPNSS